MKLSPESDPGAINRILVVDDEEIVAVALSETLRRERYEVTTAMDPIVALDHLQKHNYAVIITDQMMPMLTGLELLAQARQVQPDATRILITAVLSLDTVIDAINKGEVYRFIIKPWLREELLVTVKNAVQRYELVRKNAELQASTQAMNIKLLQLNQSLEQQVKIVAQQNTQLARFNQALEENLNHSVELCLHTIQSFYPTLGAQARRVRALCQNLGQKLNLSPEQRQTLEVAGSLHDIGLIGVPRKLISQWQQDPSKLSDAERALIEQHPALGQELAAFARGPLKDVGPTIRAHHERFDGRGYPDRLGGQDIPWLGRLLAVAVFHGAHPDANGEANKNLILQSGSAFDPAAVQALVGSLPNDRKTRLTRAVSLFELQPGMVLARGICAANGMLLAPEGQPLTAVTIERLLNHHRIRRIVQSVIIYT